MDFREKLEHLIQSISTLSTQVIVVGDTMLDEYLWCDAYRISPEAPVPICKVSKRTIVPGGAANVAHNIHTLGSSAKLFGLIGKDESGKKLKELLSQNQISTDYLTESANRPTIHKSRVIARHQHVARVDIENTEPISVTEESLLTDSLKQEIQTAQALLISDYAKGLLSASFLKSMIDLAKEKSIPIVIDPKGDDFNKYYGASILTPNKSEFESCIKTKVTQEDDYLVFGTKVIQDLNLQALLITRSEEGMTLITQDGKKIDIPTHALEVYDITGAGDTVIAALTIGISGGLSFEEASYFANVCAGVVVGKIGTATTTLKEVSHFIKLNLVQNRFSHLIEG